MKILSKLKSVSCFDFTEESVNAQCEHNFHRFILEFQKNWEKLLNTNKPEIIDYVDRLNILLVLLFSPGDFTDSISEFNLFH